MNIADVRGMTVEQVQEFLADVPLHERPNILMIDAADADAWKNFLPVDFRAPRCGGGDPWQWSAYGRTLPIRVQVA